MQYFFLKLLFFLIISQNLYGFDKKQITVDVDHAVFKKNNKENILEIYISFDESTLNYTKLNDKWTSNLIANIEIFKKRNKKIKDLSFSISHTIDNIDSLKGNIFYQNVFKVLINNDAVNFKTDIFDKENSANKINFRSQLNQINITRGNNYISDIEIAYLIKNKSKNSFEPFIKDSIEIIPNPSKNFGKENKNLYYYLEVLNIKQKALSNIGIQVFVKDLSGKKIISENYDKVLNENINQLFGMISVDNLINGEYLLEVVFEDSMGVYMLGKQKKFNIVSDFIASTNSTKLSNIEFLKAKIGIKSLESLDEEFKIIKHFATGREKRNYKKLTSHEEKVDFLTEFWNLMDPDPSTIDNESRNETMIRVGFVNKKYTVGLKKGFETDRGRVYIVYGKPDEIMRDQYDGDIRPNEIWRYHNIEGGVIFVFCDVNGSSNFRLIHSTHSNELQNYKFIERMRR
mgnify:FL=1